MIIVGLTGGLGNQLFQYALGRRIAHDRNLPLRLDINGFQNDELRAFSLQYFNIRQDFVSPEDIADLKVRKYYRIQKLLPINWRSLVIESQFRFDPRVLRTFRRHIYLEGYWQSERYFKSIESIPWKRSCRAAGAATTLGGFSPGCQRSAPSTSKTGIRRETGEFYENRSERLPA